jgi:hypothetical protein
MKIEQGMSKEEVRGLSEEMAAKKREQSQRALQADVLENLRSVIRVVSCFCIFSWRLPFFLRNSLFDILRFSRRLEAPIG